jgi:mono/diheme cytochrome c family protein
MIHSITRSLVILTALLFAFAGRSAAQEKTIKKVPIESTSPGSGAEMFKAYCAVCHGKDAKGGGPAAEALKVQPPDLTSLAKRHEGKFPDSYVSTVLRNGAKAPAHGTAEMPVWGPLFSSISVGDRALVSQRISNLTNYIKSLQAK